MAMAENIVSPRTEEETEVLLGQRYGVKPTPGCQLQPPDIHGWTPKVEPEAPPKPIPNVVTGEHINPSDSLKNPVPENGFDGAHFEAECLWSCPRKMGSTTAVSTRVCCVKILHMNIIFSQEMRERERERD